MSAAATPSRRAVGRWLVSLALLAGGCGFHPLYGEPAPAPGQTQGKSDVGTRLGQVEIAVISDRIGQELRNRLVDRFYVGDRPVSPVWRLNVTLWASKGGVGIQKDATATRYKLVVTATYSLLDFKANKRVFETRSQSVVYYNVLTAQFASFASEQDAYERAVEDLSEQITSRVALFVDRAS